jgi:predicted outer membrane protein
MRNRGKLCGGVAVAAGLVLAAAAARAADPPVDARGGRDQAILTQLHQRDQDLIAAARVAQERSARPEVRAYAARVIEDRQAADTTLMSYAELHGMNLAEIQTGAGALPHGPLATAHLTNVSAGRFDPYFARDMVAREQAAIDEAVKARALARAPRLESLIGEMAETLRQEEADAAALTSTLPRLQAPALQQPGEPAVVSWAPPPAAQ